MITEQNAKSAITRLATEWKTVSTKSEVEWASALSKTGRTAEELDAVITKLLTSENVPPSLSKVLSALKAWPKRFSARHDIGQSLAPALAPGMVKITLADGTPETVAGQPQIEHKSRCIQVFNRSGKSRWMTRQIFAYEVLGAESYKLIFNSTDITNVKSITDKAKYAFEFALSVFEGDEETFIKKLIQ